MKKLGLIGGMGPESTIPYYHDIVYGVQKKTGKDFFPPLTIESVNVFEVLQLCSKEDYDALTDYLLSAISHLVNSGADFAALTANTPHIVFDRLQNASPIPLISIVEAARDEAVRRGTHKLGLLGKPFHDSGIDIIVPNVEEMDFINYKISSELEHGIVKKETLSIFQNIISHMKKENSIESVILGCTELPLLLNDSVSPVPCLDTMQIHIQALIDGIVSPA